MPAAGLIRNVVEEIGDAALEQVGQCREMMRLEARLTGFVFAVLGLGDIEVSGDGRLGQLQLLAPRSYATTHVSIQIGHANDPLIRSPQ